MKRFVSIGIATALLFATLITTSAFASEERPPWYGEPDPFACNQFQDCWWTLPVCIEGATYEVGIYFDPALATPEQIAAAAMQWSGTELTAGACQAPPVEPVVRNLWAYVNPAATEGARNICYILSLTQPTQSEESNDVQRLCFLDLPDWYNGAVVLTHGDVYENGTDWGFWEGDAAAAAFSGAPRLPLHADGPNNDLVDKAEMYPWTQ
jgi:hypothetical protein